MPKYFFDVYDGESEFTDDGGIDMAHNDIPAEARNLLRLLAYAKVPHDKPSMLVADVRNEAGQVVYQASAELRRCTAQAALRGESHD